jgi:uncharacterized protein (DUF2249 family)
MSVLIDEDPAPEERLARILADATLALGRAGDPVAASRLAARALAEIRPGHPTAERRLNGVMHALARLPRSSPATETKENEMAITPLDVRSEPPARRHELIFNTFETLARGDGFELINDHDPKPLYYQLEAEQTGNFSWKYLEQGPEVWRVEIGRIA